MSKNVKKNKLSEIEENPVKEGIIFKKRILSINKRDNNKSNAIKNNFSFKNMKKNFSIKFSKQNIKNNESFNESMIPLNTLKKKSLLYKKSINSPITDRNTYGAKGKLNSNSNSKFKYHKKLNIQSPKIILNLPENDIYAYNGHISPRIPKIIFQSGNILQYSGQNIPRNPIPKYQNNPKKMNYRKYNKIIINNIFEMNKNKENNMNFNNIINKKNMKKLINDIPKNKGTLKKRNSFCNYSKQITHFALQKGKNKNTNNKYLPQQTQQKNYNNENILYELYSPRNNYKNNNTNNNTNSTIKSYYETTNKNKELLTDGNININSNYEQYKTNRISKISLKHSINKKINKYNLENLDILQNNKTSLNNIKQDKNKNKKLETEEIKIKNSKLLDYMKKSKSNKKEQSLNTSLNYLNFNVNSTYDKYSKRKRNLSFNIFNSFNPDNNPLLFSNDDSCMNNNNNMTFLSNGSIFSNNNNINEKRVIFNRKIDYKKNKFNGDYVELAKICANQEKIISDLVKNVQCLNNQICDKDLCINELNNQLYSIKYDLLNTLQKTNGKS